MKGLLLRLSALDADAATAVRVIAHFEALLGSGALDATSLARSTAGLAECAAGLELPDGRRARFGPGGAALPAEPKVVSQDAELGPSGRVWLERPGPPGPFDDLILEWMAIAARTLCGSPAPPRMPHASLTPRTPGSREVADPALMEVVLSERESDHDRARALRLLGLAPELPLRMVAVRGDPAVDAGLDAVALLGRATLDAVVRVTRTGPWGTVLVQPPDGAADSPAAALRAAVADPLRGAVADPLRGPDVPRDAARRLRVGVGGLAPGLAAQDSWRQACTALRFAVAGSPREAVVDHDALGPVALLADIPAERLGALPEARQLDALATQPNGCLTIAALAAFCRTGSLRQAAAELHLHHSSVAARLAHVEAALGWRLRDPEHRFQAQLALYARRLAAAEVNRALKSSP
ncbi:PucR family transcriptional regulator [Streptomyces sp. ME19-01-6]|uniref:PucR family transcriptional regulator n=1 Tax=Streptomyces sp. ME19-01-6 TaxID=3028686 RepID=UPI0029AA1767|nr:helix-turn-helix domain-containing protein [Streptomyces sp. ME19-01-6]MDX3228997.1 helix-turn-helix domain-containing protein [Streptomyces sp. ME19-01-6]